MVIIYLTDFIGQDSRSSLTGVLVLVDIVAKMLAGVAVI